MPLPERPSTATTSSASTLERDAVEHAALRPPTSDCLRDPAGLENGHRFTVPSRRERSGGAGRRRGRSRRRSSRCRRANQRPRAARPRSRESRRRGRSCAISGCGHARPREPRAGDARRFRAAPASSTSTRPAARARRAARRRRAATRRCVRAAVPASRRYRCCRRGAARCATFRHPVARRRCRRRSPGPRLPTASSTATGERSTPSANTPRAASACRWRPGPQPTSRTGPREAVQELLVGRIGRTQITLERKRDRPCRRSAARAGARSTRAPARSPSPYMLRALITESRRALVRIACAEPRTRPRARPRSCRRRAAVAARGPATRARSSRARCLIQVDSQLIGTSVKAPETRLAEPHAPVAAVVCPAEHRVDVVPLPARASRRAAAAASAEACPCRRAAPATRHRRTPPSSRSPSPAAALRYYLESLAQPTPSVALEHEHFACRRGTGNNVERVEQRRPRQLSRLVHAARRRQSRLGAARQRFLRDHEHSNGFHPSKLIRSGLQKTKA